MRKMIPVRKAIGMILCHDITEVTVGKFKGRAFKKGHVVTEEDIPKLLRLGKENIFALSLDGDQIHEDDAALRIGKAAAGSGLSLSPPCEGRVDLIAQTNGLLKINVEALTEINSIGDVVFGSLHTNQQVVNNRVVGSTRIIPLVTEEERVRKVEEICSSCFPLAQIKPFRSMKVGVVTTGSEVFHGRIEDGFGPVLKRKFRELGCEIIDQVFVSDVISSTVSAIHNFIEQGADMIAVTGGMSVDPDDQTPASIRSTGAEIISYGAPTFPGAMFMLAYMGKIPIIGLPACVMYFRASVFDLIVPRILADEAITRRDIAVLGHGGLCSLCKDCRYPVCSFGKG